MSKSNKKKEDPPDLWKNPYITKPISKSLLVPLRQMGLSRIRKSPLTTNKSNGETPPNVETKSLITNPNKSDPRNTQTPSKLQITPKRVIGLTRKPRKSLKNNEEKKSEVSDNNVSSVEVGSGEHLKQSGDLVGLSKKKSKISDNDSSITFGSDEHLNQSKKLVGLDKNKSQASDNDSTVRIRSDESLIQPKNLVGLSKKKLKVSDNDSSDRTTEHLKHPKSLVGLPKKTKASFDSPGYFKESNKLLIQDGQEKTIEDTVNDTLVKQEISKKSENSKKMVKRLASDLSDSDDEPLSKICHTVKIDNVVKNETNREKLVCSDNKQKNVNTKKIKRSLSLKKITGSSEDVTIKKCSVSLTPLDVDLETKIKLIKKEIAEKKQLEEELKRAENYRRINKIEDIEKETQVWKNGCMRALEDLLIFLKQHDPNFQMENLLKNLGVPEKLLSF